MTDKDPNLPQQVSSSWDSLGLGEVAKQLVGPITRGVGKVLAPIQRRREDRAQRENFDDWDVALKRKGFQIGSVELTLGERTEVRALAEQIGQQRNREEIAWETIEHAKSDDLPTIPSLSAPSPDWLDHYWRLAQNIDDSEMQSFWGLVLARRATKKAAFSARALDFLSTLTGDEARDLERLAKCAVTTMIGDYVDTGLMYSISTYEQPLSGEKKSELESLRAEFGRILDPIRADLFGPLGIYLQEGFAHTFTLRPIDGVASLAVADHSLRCRVAGDFIDQHGLFSLGGGKGVSPLGREIFGILKSRANDDYIKVLKRGFEIKGLTLERVP